MDVVQTRVVAWRTFHLWSHADVEAVRPTCVSRHAPTLVVTSHHAPGRGHPARDCVDLAVLQVLADLRRRLPLRLGHQCQHEQRAQDADGAEDAEGGSLADVVHAQVEEAHDHEHEDPVDAGRQAAAPGARLQRQELGHHEEGQWAEADAVHEHEGRQAADGQPAEGVEVHLRVHRELSVVGRQGNPPARAAISGRLAGACCRTLARAGVQLLLTSSSLWNRK